jgi:hypothetical protein
MNFRIIALASCIALGSIALGGKAQAQTVVVPFEGTITNACVFGAPSNGVLARPGALNAVEGSAGLTGFGTGTASRVSVNCPTGASLTVAPPIAAAVPGAFASPVLQSVVQLNASANFTSAGGPFDTGVWAKSTAAMLVPAGPQTLNVGMIAGTNAAGFPPAGAYNYNVTLTATPN